ncbi:sugar phosphate isomerase/epimerase family protein [Konateibacter massiliensis]|uniref:sugar phosphate isomerase/epimerase family protein n=1 Tax=Konateibacter massiliensis TaxID=2002841 RepID=UPI000C14B9B3|nr:TIM barrel protein [Konateibacter massiliensis]
MSNIKLGATLFCYGTEYARYEYDFEECVKQAALAGATGYEIVATQMIPSYPNVSDEFLGLVNKLKAKYQIAPVGYGANNDKGMRWDRNLTDDEMLADAIIDLKAANKLGCKVMRAQYMLSPEAFERLAEYAELYDVKVGIEIHNPETPSSPKIQEYLKVIKRTGSKYLGFVPDFGCFSVAPNKPHWDKALKAGVKEEYLQLAAKMRTEGASMEETTKTLSAAGAHPMINMVIQGMYGFVQFRPKSELPALLESLKEILPYCFEMHGKFHYLSEDCVEPSIPYGEILAVLKESDYGGYIICEYEDEIGCGGTEFTKRQIAMEKKILGIK